jgi:hypothetical protein
MERNVGQQVHQQVHVQLDNVKIILQQEQMQNVTHSLLDV